MCHTGCDANVVPRAEGCQGSEPHPTTAIAPKSLIPTQAPLSWGVHTALATSANELSTNQPGRQAEVHERLQPFGEQRA